MGYLRDPLVSSLMTQLRVNRQRRGVETLGILNFWDTPEGDRLTILGRGLHRGIQERAETLGYGTDYIWAREPGMTARRLSRILSARGIRGVIILSMLHARGHVALDWKRFAAASVGFTLHKPELHRANYSHYHAMFLALRTLRRRGYRRVGFTNLIGQEDMVNNERLSAYLGYHYRVEGRMTVPPLLVKQWDWQTLGPWLEEHRPQAIVSNNVDAVLLARQHGIRVPEDLGFASLDCIDEAMLCAGIQQPRDLVGARAVELVVEQLENHESGLPKAPKLVTVKGEWQDGPTLLAKAGK